MFNFLVSLSLPPEILRVHSFWLVIFINMHNAYSRMCWIAGFLLLENRSIFITSVENQGQEAVQSHQTVMDS